MARTRPPELQRGDLARAVADMRADLFRRYGLRVAVEWPPAERPLRLVTAVTLYRFFQEALLNVVKHADVDEARARLAFDGTWVVATVTDLGVGFAPDTVRGVGGRQAGLGLLRGRARAVGGTLQVEPAEGGGTRVCLRLPAPDQPEPVDGDEPAAAVGAAGGPSGVAT
jgi:signal transduction histidine kinase